MKRSFAVVRPAVSAFAADHMTHHAAALTYYALMSLFPTLLLGMALLGLLGQFPETYDAVISYLGRVAPKSMLAPIDAALRGALESRGTAAGALVVAVTVSLYGATALLEAARRALNVALEVDHGRGLLRRTVIDVVSAVVLMTLALVTLLLMFVGGGLADAVFDLVGLGPAAASAWSILRWPAALAVATLVFSFVYYVTPDVEQRAFRWVIPGALVGVVVWLLASAGLSLYLSRFPEVNATYGSFGAAIALLLWLWLTNVALLFGGELNAEIERAKQLDEGVPEPDTLALSERR